MNAPFSRAFGSLTQIDVSSTPYHGRRNAITKSRFDGITVCVQPLKKGRRGGQEMYRELEYAVYISSDICAMKTISGIANNKLNTEVYRQIFTHSIWAGAHANISFRTLMLLDGIHAKGLQWVNIYDRTRARAAECIGRAKIIIFRSSKRKRGNVSR